MKRYEVMFIINSTLEDDAKTAIIDMAQEAIATDGEVIKVDLMGNKKLAYPIQKRNDGYYVSGARGLRYIDAKPPDV